MVKVAIPTVIEGEGAISRGFKVITPNANAWIALPIDGHESAIVVPYNPYCARSGAIEHEVIKFATVVVVESEGKIGSGFEVVSSNTDARITLPVDRRERIRWSAHVELQYDVNLE